MTYPFGTAPGINWYGQSALSAEADTVLATIGDYVQINGTFTDDGVNKGFTTAANGDITWNGSKTVNCHFNGTSDLEVSKASQISYALFVNGVLVPDAVTEHDFPANGKKENISITRIFPLTPGDVISVRATTDTTNVTLTVNTLNTTFIVLD